ncbi:hypothetical protein [Paractinoplanes atraurantiacus]|uniref:Uncharacterized protein n=1 Tax=Paractinoplanes atraurantiacus TaxID=1036182 RepID=A0A285KA54_9ACTN|nr:hypothetical protein [Actinoplanes atraurantiacus]SNY69489.1 hypothetical protein SAMN05421748_13557 [Actinoplanes atraurantiacus]
MLADVGAGSWQPERDATNWVRLNLVAHHMQAQTVLRRVDDVSKTWLELEGIVKQHRLPERALFALYTASLGLKVRRTVYEKDAEIEVGTANRDLRLLVSAGLLAPQGETKGRYYVGTPELRDIRKGVVGERPQPRNPYGTSRPRRTV